MFFDGRIRNVRVPLTLLAVALCLSSTSHGLVVPLPAAAPTASLAGFSLPRLRDGADVDIGGALAATPDGERTMLVLGTHPADFNAVEYCQRVRASWARLREEGVGRVMVILNGSPSSCSRLAGMLDLPDGLEIFADPAGEAGRRFGVSRGFRPDDEGIPAALKVTVVGLGLGPPWGTLPAVVAGYVGDPHGKRRWIEESLKQGQLAGRWPTVLELDPGTNAIVGNKFDDFPLVAGWGRRPFELATLRLQNIIDIQIKHWEDLKPVDERCLTQLGGCTIVGTGGKAIYSWVDRGLCDVPDMEDILESIHERDPL